MRGSDTRQWFGDKNRVKWYGRWWGVCLFLAAPFAMATGVWHYKDLGNRMISGDLYVGSDLTVADDLTITGDTVYTLGAAEKVQIDASTTAQTQTGGALDLDFASVTADANALELAATVNTGTTAAANIYASVWTLTCNDADADMFGLSITAAATANAAAGSYEYGLSYDCAENTAGACLDGILVTSSGVDVGMTDGLDVSAANIANAVNIGVNPILGGNSDSFTCGATDATFTVTRNDAGVVTYTGADDATPGDVTYDCTGACAIIAGSADVTSFTVTTDGTGTGEVVLPLQSIAGAELVNDTVDGAQLIDTIDLDASLTFTAGAAEQIIVNRTFTDGGTESGQQINCTTLDTGAATGNQFCLELDNRASTEAADAMLTIDNSDTDDVVADGIRFIDAGGGFTDYLDAPNLRIVGATGLVTWLPASFNDSASYTADDVFTLDRDDTGSVTLTATDDDANATLIVAGGGTGETTVGSATNTAINLLSDGTGTGEVTMVAGAVDGTEILDGTVNAADLAFAGRGQFTICGDATTVNANTVYYGPDMAVVTSATVGLNRRCDTTAAGNVTEATADAPAYTATAFHVLGMECMHVDSGFSLSFTLRTAAGATTPSVTCSTVDNDLGCVADVQTTTQIASGATVAVAVASASDVTTANVPFVCTVFVAF